MYFSVKIAYVSAVKQKDGCKSAFFLERLYRICGCGGIGRHARFRFWSARVQVQVLSSALVLRVLVRGHRDSFCLFYTCNSRLLNDRILKRFVNFYLTVTKIGFFYSQKRYLIEFV